ncbi:hypothetical protein BZA77DRAFT_43080 [Pyronema omphalodes]|nr:hypothetical protein BZA77DRAFT_43080 [Pyronema omphalodes]
MDQTSPTAQIAQLSSVRDLVLKDPSYWPQVVETVLSVITGKIELRRWGADFLAETFSTPVVDPRAKGELALKCLDTILLLVQEKETNILKSIVQCAASIYPMVFKHICNNRNDTESWNKMIAIKQKILSLWDIAPIGVRISCIKFVQRVILVQSRGVTDPRLIDRSEISLAMVPANHPLLSLPALDAEAQGLLDRLLSILQEEQSEPTLITATINTLAPLCKTRPPLLQKIVTAVLAYNPFTNMPRVVGVSERLILISIEKTIRIMIQNVGRANPQSPLASRMEQHIRRLAAAKAEMNETRKRAAGSSDVDIAKRQKLERASAVPPISPPTPPPAPVYAPMPPGPATYAKIFTLATDPAMTSFDGQQLPIDLVLRIVVGSMYSMDSNSLTSAIAAVKERYENVLANPPSAAPPPAAEGVKQEAADIKAEQKAAEEEDDEIQLSLGEFRLPPPPKLNAEQAQASSIAAMDRMFSVIDSFEPKSLIARKSKLGVNRLAASSWDREGWIALLIRMATRGSQDDTFVKSEPGTSPTCLANAVRERLYLYVIADFRTRWDIAVTWLNEEWYNDKIMEKSEHGQEREKQYNKWMMKVMESIIPFLAQGDKIFIRMMSEIPEIPLELIERVKGLCLDPDRLILGTSILQYMAMYRPPVKDICLNFLEELWINRKFFSHFLTAIITIT